MTISKKEASEREELLDVLEDVLCQACGTDKEDELDSMALTSYARGLRLLAKYKKIKITSEYGKSVIAKISK